MYSIFTHTFTVDASSVDLNGHVNNVVFVQWMQDIATEHAAAAGGTEATRALDATWYVKSHRVEYLSAAHEGEEVQAYTWVADMGRIRSTRKYLFRRISDGRDLVRGETDWVFIDAQTGRPKPIPESVSQCFDIVNDEDAP